MSDEIRSKKSKKKKALLSLCGCGFMKYHFVYEMSRHCGKMSTTISSKVTTDQQSKTNRY